jgi:choline-glycine betaine transporter
MMRLFDPTFLFVAAGVACVGLTTWAGYEFGKFQNSPDDNDQNNSRQNAVTIGSVLAGAVFGIVAVAFVYWFWFRKQKFHLQPSSSSPIFTPSDLKIMKQYGALPEQVTRRNQSR